MRRRSLSSFIDMKLAVFHFCDLGFWGLSTLVVACLIDRASILFCVNRNASVHDLCLYIMWIRHVQDLRMCRLVVSPKCIGC
jgi:hypothetical protein